ncbi:MAG: MarR family winged helix-turn-helix transcriptional regulator [Acidimicrobiia bacterium]
MPTRRTWTPELQRDTIGFLFALVDGIRTRFEAAAAASDLTPSQAYALLQIGEPRPMSQLADTLSCDRSNVTAIVDKLESGGLVERRIDPEDRRVKNLALTPAGADLRRKLEDGMTEWLPDELSKQDVEVLVGLLKKVTAI